MRYKLIQEGVEDPFGRFLEVGSLKFPDELLLYTQPYSFVYSDINHQERLGVVTDIRREDDGWITVEIADGLITKDYYPTLYANDLIFSDDNRNHIVSAEVRVCYRTPAPYAPFTEGSEQEHYES